MMVNETLINRRRKHDVSKCSVRLYDPNFICIRQSQLLINIYQFSSIYRASIHLSPLIISLCIRHEILSNGSSPGTF